MPTSEQYTLNLGDVVVVPFPFTDKLSEKRRPAAVVSSDEVHAAGYIWLVMITSASRQAVPFDVEIPYLSMAGLTAASRVRPLKIACTEPLRIVRKIGRLDAMTTKSIIDGINRLTGRVTDIALFLDQAALRVS